MRNSRRRYSYPSRQSRNKGSILIVTVWVMVAFSILSVGLYNVVSSRLNLSQALEGRITGQFMARAACIDFKERRAKKVSAVDTIYELGQKQTQELGRGKFTYTLKDENSRININSASADVMARLPGFDKDLAQKVYESALKPFHAKEELLLVEDVSEEAFNSCKDLITVYGTGGVNINTASPQIMKILGLDDSLISAISAFRAGSDGKEGTIDDGVFDDTAGIINKLRSATSLYTEQEVKLIQLISQNMFSVESQSFSLQIETTIFEKTTMRYNIVMDKDGIKRWEEF